MVGDINLVAPESEESLLALALESNSVLVSAISSGVKPEDFGTASHELIFRTMRDMLDKGMAIDSATLISQLETSSKLDLIGGKGAIERLTTRAPAHGANEYIQIIKDRSIRRSVFDASESILRLLHTEPDIYDVVNKSENLIYRVGDKLTGGSKTGIDASSLVEMYANRTSERDRIPYAFKTLNIKARGRNRGSLSIYGAYSSDGKTTVGTINALTAAQQGYKTAVFSLEMTEEELLYRLIAMYTGISSQRIEQGDLSLEEDGMVNAAIREIGQLPITFYHDPSYSPSEIGTIQMREKFDLIVIDYLQRFDWNAWSDFPHIAKTFKNMALKTDCCVDLLSQLRMEEYRPGQNPFGVPNLNSLYGGRATAHEADNVFFPWAMRDKDEETGQWTRNGMGKLICAKQRGGEGEFMFDIVFDPKHVMWKEPEVENVFILPVGDSR